MTDSDPTPRARSRTPDAPPSAAEARWQEWYESHSAAVYGYVRFHVASPDEADDLTAETFFRALRASERFDPSRAGVKTWLLAIARNAVRDHRRRSRVRRHVPIAGMRDLVSDHPSPEERLLWEEEVGRILSAVDRLPEGDREIIGLRYGSELEPAEVARALGIRESAARTRLWRALGRLREVMQGQ